MREKGENEIGGSSTVTVDALQRGVTQQLMVMMTATALPDWQTSWKWDSGLTKQENSTEMW